MKRKFGESAEIWEMERWEERWWKRDGEDVGRRRNRTFDVSFLPLLLELAHFSKLGRADRREISGMREKDDPWRRREGRYKGEGRSALSLPNLRSPHHLPLFEPR